MNDFILNNLKKLKKNKIQNPEIDLRILLNYSKKFRGIFGKSLRAFL